MSDVVAIIGGIQCLPLARLLVPHPVFLAVVSLKDQDQAAKAKDVDGPFHAVDIDHLRVAVQVAAKGCLNAVGFKHQAQFFRRRNARVADEVFQIRHSFVALLHVKRAVKLDKLLQSLRHSQHQREDLALHHRHFADGLGYPSLFPVLVANLLLQQLVVDSEAVYDFQFALVSRGQFFRLSRGFVNALLRLGGGLVAGDSGVHNTVNLVSAKSRSG